MLTTVSYAEEEEEEEEVAEEEITDKAEAPQKNTTEKAIEQLRKVEEDTKARNLARAETSYSEGEPATAN
jgi:hypothetical protein